MRRNCVDPEDAVVTFGVAGRNKNSVDAVTVLRPYLRTLHLDLHGEDDRKWSLQLDDGQLRELEGREVVYPGEHALLAAPTLAQPSSPPPNAASFDVAGRLSIDRSRKEDAAEALRTWLSSPAKPRGDVPDLVGSDLAKLLNTLFSLSVVYDCEGNGETNEDDAINVKLDDVTDDRIYDGLTVLVPYLLDLRLECDDWFDLKWLIVLAGDRLHYLEGQVVYSS